MNYGRQLYFLGCLDVLIRKEVYSTFKLPELQSRGLIGANLQRSLILGELPPRWFTRALLIGDR